MEELRLTRAYRYIEPGPVLLVSTASADGVPNLMAMSYHMVIEDGGRPLIGCMLGPWDFSFGALRDTGECVLAVPAADLVETVVDIGNCTGAETDKFKAFGLTPLPAARVKAPLVKECLVNLECRVFDDSLIDKYSLVILEVVQAWIDTDRAERRLIHHNGDGTVTLGGETLDFKDRMVQWPSYTQP